MRSSIDQTQMLLLLKYTLIMIRSESMYNDCLQQQRQQENTEIYPSKPLSYQAK